MKKASPAEPVASSPAGAAALALCAGVAAEKQSVCSDARRRSANAAGLWLWVAGAFLLLVIAWTVMFRVARSAKIESVPLSTSGGATR